VTPLSGRFYRIIFATDLPNVLDGALSPEGRFHHHNQRTIYMSPSPQAAAVAVNIYLKPDDPPRLVVPLRISAARILDFRTPETEKSLGLEWRETAVPWAKQRAAGLPATSWRASDAARAAGADGMIYPSRTLPSRWWHLVLFDWNTPGSAQIQEDGSPFAFIPST